MTDDIWQEGAIESECPDCGHTSRSCTCYEMECKQCNRVVDPADAREWNEDYFCDETCLNLYLET